MSGSERAVIRWLAGSDTGISSKALAFAFLGVAYAGPGGMHGPTPPADPADLGRCLRLIALVPAVRACVDELAARHDAWGPIAAVWDYAARTMADEAGIDWSRGRAAPRTYAIMRGAA